MSGDPRDATIARLRAELAASAEEHQRSEMQFLFYVKGHLDKSPPDRAKAFTNQGEATRCAAAAKRAREGAEQ